MNRRSLKSRLSNRERTYRKLLNTFKYDQVCVLHTTLHALRTRWTPRPVTDSLVKVDSQVSSSRTFHPVPWVCHLAPDSPGAQHDRSDSFYSHPLTQHPAIRNLVKWGNPVHNCRVRQQFLISITWQVWRILLMPITLHNPTRSWKHHPVFP